MVFGEGFIYVACRVRCKECVLAVFNERWSLESLFTLIYVEYGVKNVFFPTRVGHW